MQRKIEEQNEAHLISNCWSLPSLQKIIKAINYIFTCHSLPNSGPKLRKEQTRLGWQRAPGPVQIGKKKMKMKTDADRRAFRNDLRDCRPFRTALTRARWLKHARAQEEYKDDEKTKKIGNKPALWLTHVLTGLQLDSYQHDELAHWPKHVHFFLSSTSTPTAGVLPENKNEILMKAREREREREREKPRQPLLQSVRECG